MTRGKVRGVWRLSVPLVRNLQGRQGFSREVSRNRPVLMSDEEDCLSIPSSFRFENLCLEFIFDLIIR